MRDDLDALDTVLTVDVDDTQSEERDFWDALDERSTAFDVIETSADEDAIIIYSSGTMGAPKGVLHGHRMLLGHLPLFLTSFCNRTTSVPAGQ